MTTSRMEAFSDGVLAIVITIMVLELGVPEGADLEALRPRIPIFLAYILSFVFLGIYWNNHHHMLQAAERINGKILWANLHLLFWLSMFPFMTGWMGGSSFAPVPVAMYGIVSLMAAVAYFILQTTIISEHGRNSRLATALGRDLKGKASPLLYLGAIAAAFLSRWISLGLYVLVAVIWLIPDRRIESLLRGPAEDVS